MCYSEQSSLFAFTIGLIGSSIAFSLGSVMDKIVGSFCGYISFMQIFDYLLWRHQMCDSYNKTVSVTAMLFNHTQILFLGFIILYFNGNHVNQKYVKWILLMSTLVFLVYTYQWFLIKLPDELCTIKDYTTPHLLWKWTQLEYSTIAYTIFYAIPAALLFIEGIPNKMYGIFIAFIVLFTFATSYIFYKHNVGALWCHYSTFLPILYSGVRMLQ